MHQQHGEGGEKETMNVAGPADEQNQASTHCLQIGTIRRKKERQTTWYGYRPTAEDEMSESWNEVS